MMPNRPQRPEVEPDWLVSFIEQHWVLPCSAKLPEIMHGTPVEEPARHLPHDRSDTYRQTRRLQSMRPHHLGVWAVFGALELASPSPNPSPQPKPGMCVVVPAMAVCLCLVGIVLLLKWNSERKTKSEIKKKE